MNEKLLTPFVLNYPFLQDKPTEELNTVLVEAILSAKIGLKWEQLPDCSSCRTMNGNFCLTGVCWRIVTANNVCGCFAKGANPNKGALPGDPPPNPKTEIMELPNISTSLSFTGGGSTPSGGIRQNSVCLSIPKRISDALKEYNKKMDAEADRWIRVQMSVYSDFRVCRIELYGPSGAGLYGGNQDCFAIFIDSNSDGTANVRCGEGYCGTESCCLKAKERMTRENALHKQIIDEANDELAFALEEIDRLRRLNCKSSVIVDRPEF